MRPRALTLVTSAVVHKQLVQKAASRLAEVLSSLVAEITVPIKQLVEESSQAQLLMTISAISYYSALLILSEMGQIERFRTAKNLCSYAGLVPSEYSSHSKSFMARITTQGYISIHAPTEMPVFRVYIAGSYGAGTWLQPQWLWDERF